MWLDGALGKAPSIVHVADIDDLRHQECAVSNAVNATREVYEKIDELDR